jgi:hypothetical protein
MKYFALFLAVSITTGATSQTTDNARRWPVDRPDRTITWKPWHQNSQFEYRFRTGDRYLGHRVWEHYLLFEEQQSSEKLIKFSMIHLAQGHGLDNVVVRPGLRYAIFEVTNSNMTAHKGVWSWTAQELKHVFEKKGHLIAVN